MSVESQAEASGSIRSRIAAHPVTAFLILAIPLAWLAQCLAIVLLTPIPFAVRSGPAVRKEFLSR